MINQVSSKKNNKNKLMIALGFIIVLILVIGISYIWTKLSSVNYQKIDKTNLDINEDLYQDVSNVNENITKDNFDKVKTVVFFGTDSRDTENMSSGRSDTIIIASINPVTKRIKLISIPRDTYVTIPNNGQDKINHAYAYGGEELSIKTINNNFGLAISEYVTIDFSGLVNVIDTVGGININVTEAEKAFINRGSKTKLSTSGNVLLNGEQALIHSRNRTVGNDFERAARQRIVLEALIKKIGSMEVSQMLNLSDKMLKEVKTNMNITDYTSMLTSIATNKSEYLNDIKSIQIPSTDYSSGQMISGVYYFVPDMEKSKQDFYKTIYE